MASNPTLSQIKVGNVVYDICDTNVRNNVSSLNNSVITLNDSVTTLNNSLSNLTSKLKDVKLATSTGECFYWKTIPTSVTVPASGTKKAEFNMTVNEYSYLGPVGFNTGGASVYCITLNPDSMMLRNTSATTTNVTPSIKGLYTKINWNTHT